MPKFDGDLMKAMCRPKRKTLTQVRMEDPFMEPDWRFRRILAILSAPKVYVPNRCDDAFVRAALPFIREWQKADSVGRDRLSCQNSGLAAAYQLYERRSTSLEEDLLPAFIAESRLLSRQTAGDVSFQGKLTKEALCWYSVLFFDVIDYLNQRDWVLHRVLLPSCRRATYLLNSETYDKHDTDGTVLYTVKPIVAAFLDWTLKYFSFFGGPILCSYLIHNYREGKLIRTPDDIEAHIDEQWISSLKTRSLQAIKTFSISNYNVTELFKIHAAILDVQQRSRGVGGQPSDLDVHVKELLNSAPWVVGEEGVKVMEGTEVGAYDRTSMELTDDELLLMGAGQTPASVRGLTDVRLGQGRKPKEVVSP